jgi:hypothetical protein
MLLLTACDPGDSSEVVVKIICARIVEYDQKTQDRALAELEKLPADSALRLFIGDYGRLRNQIRECRARNAVKAS